MTKYMRWRIIIFYYAVGADDFDKELKISFSTLREWNTRRNVKKVKYMREDNDTKKIVEKQSQEEIAYYGGQR